MISTQLFWSRKLRRNIAFTFFMSIIINIGMWYERFVLIVTSLHRDYLPSNWSNYEGSWVEVGIFTFTLGLFFTLYLLFARAFPVIAIAEVKAVLSVSGNKARERDFAKIEENKVTLSGEILVDPLSPKCFLTEGRFGPFSNIQDIRFFAPAALFCPKYH